MTVILANTGAGTVIKCYKVDDTWTCPGCGNEVDDREIDILTSPTEEASYPDDNLEPEPEWLD